MNFYASQGYLGVVAEVCFPGRATAIEDVRVGAQVLRLLVVDAKRVVMRGPFLDYHEPLAEGEGGAPAREIGHAEPVSCGIIGYGEDAPPGLTRAPFVDWAGFDSFEAYWAHIRSRNKRLLQDQKRRRARLEETLGPLTFSTHDEGEDVFPLAREWKGRQLLASVGRDYFTQPANIAFFHALKARGLLTASTLRAGGRLVSVWLGFIYEGVWSGWVFTYDPDPALRKYSLGHQLLHSMLEESHRRGHSEFDFSAGDENYKWVYATHARLIGALGRAPLHLHLLNSAKQAAKSLVRRGRRVFSKVNAVGKAAP